MKLCNFCQETTNRTPESWNDTSGNNMQGTLDLTDFHVIFIS